MYTSGVSRIVVFVRGGVLQGAISSHDNLEVMVVDYDDEKDTNDKKRNFEKVPCDTALIDAAARGEI